VGVDCPPFELLLPPNKLPKMFKREERKLGGPEVAGWVVVDGIILIWKGRERLEPYGISAVKN